MPLHTFGRDESLKLPLQSKFDRITIDPMLASKLKPVEIRPGVMFATVTGKLEVSNNTYHLEWLQPEISKDTKSSKRQKKETKAPKDGHPQHHHHGKVNISTLLQNLTANGLSAAKVEEPGPGSFIVHLEQDEALIQVDETETHVVCEDGAEKTRELIRKSILACLQAF